MQIKILYVVIAAIVIAGIVIWAITAPLVDPCADVTCQENQNCVEGECVLKTCEEQGGSVCLEDQTCGQLLEASDSEACCAVECQAVVVNPCEGVECLEGEECVEGVCVVIDLCAGVECPEGQQCVGGECVEDPCAEVECPEGQECVDGDCAVIETATA